eukprot:1406766-Lingulodinium_polyedra.AAC.1
MALMPKTEQNRRTRERSLDGSGSQSFSQTITAASSTRWFWSDKLTFGPRAKRYRAYATDLTG